MCLDCRVSSEICRRRRSDGGGVGQRDYPVATRARPQAQDRAPDPDQSKKTHPTVPPSAPLPKPRLWSPSATPALKAEPQTKTKPKPVLKPEVKPQAPKIFAACRHEAQGAGRICRGSKILPKNSKNPSYESQRRIIRFSRREIPEQQIAINPSLSKRLCRKLNYDDRAARDD